MSKLRMGAIGMVDALGFKGIWRRHQPLEGIVSLLRDVQTYLRDHVGEMLKRVTPPGASWLPIQVSAFSFSDTLVLAAIASAEEYRFHERDVLADAAGLVAIGIAYLMRHAAKAEIPLIYRGVITTGDCFVDRETSVFLGDPVDEAAELMESADGAIVWLSPGTYSLDLRPWTRLPAWSELLPDFDVPLKGGRTVRSKVVNPFVHTSHQGEEFALIRRGYESVFSSSQRLDVMVKRQNTDKLLDHFEDLSREQMKRALMTQEAIAELRRTVAKAEGTE